ncbi:MULTISPECIES: multicopper oxidase family protein [unclassified Streptomyces]|uniref:multicopper oxidase family protein n=1 Tax=unclassified Streptomyces TaxID=2593676 RepID=UPI00224EF4E6|nr:MULTISPECIES: multicopper oxidase family protein [unclassified Streptomyces]WSP55313.1 multicopper oxidase family protein [Streptomyces sp. NBC_01241]WSU23957.1 multicopper oxidase family protein [Streptomyces sp. NBC_01108]MCX4786991.1 multicopper oxidase family protein [Streptomyces sp. NBC_01221]MCX4797227.1 multicopper oxidase family protein [Streptomyces sp. NBC_01242]WSJ38520.1 multicopper oxidase family protein [Streptomyces sp. NBC_01321]
MTRSNTRFPLPLTVTVLAVAGLSGGAGHTPTEYSHTPYGLAATAGSAQGGVGPLLKDPPEVVSRGGLLKTTIVVERRKVQVGDRQLYATTYNGAYMPPTLRVRPGDRIDLTMVNKTDKYTNLHTHGLMVSPRAPADDIFISIKYGHSYHYAYQLPRDHPTGTFWYHSHADMLSAAQVAGGESGIIVVEGLKRYLPPSLRRITEHTIALKDDQVEGDAIKTHPLSIGASTNRTVNGQQNPVIHIRPGETQLWRLANIGANIYYKLHLPGTRFHVIAQDGAPVRRTYAKDTLLIPAASRFDVLVQGGAPGTARLETLPYNTGPAGNQFPQVDLATVVTGGTPMPRAAIPSRFAPQEDLSNAKIAARKTMVYTENTAGTVFYINGRTFDPKRTDFTSTLGTVEEWTVRNDSDEDHSFHLHTDHFQLMSTNGKAEDPSHSVYDTVNVPRRGAIVLRVHFTHFTGRTVLHCHILNHEDMGMMAVLDIAPPRARHQETPGK